MYVYVSIYLYPSLYVCFLCVNIIVYTYICVCTCMIVCLSTRVSLYKRECVYLGISEDL